MKLDRATHDPAVIEAWAARVAQRARGIGRLQHGLMLAMVLSAMAAVLLQSGTWGRVFATLFIPLLVARIVDRLTLLCPHCNRPPIGVLQRGPPEGVDYCQQCHYWLRSPYGIHRHAPD